MLGGAVLFPARRRLKCSGRFDNMRPKQGTAISLRGSTDDTLISWKQCRTLANRCRTAGIGCIECKAKMADHLIEWITPVRERRLEYEKHPKRVLEVIDEGSKRARVEAQKTIGRVREAVFGWEKKRNEIGQL